MSKRVIRVEDLRARLEWLDKLKGLDIQWTEGDHHVEPPVGLLARLNKVYTAEDYEGLAGVFSTRELAQAYCDECFLEDGAKLHVCEREVVCS